MQQRILTSFFQLLIIRHSIIFVKNCVHFSVIISTIKCIINIFLNNFLQLECWIYIYYANERSAVMHGLCMYKIHYHA